MVSSDQEIDSMYDFDNQFNGQNTNRDSVVQPLARSRERGTA